MERRTSYLGSTTQESASAANGIRDRQTQSTGRGASLGGEWLVWLNADDLLVEGGLDGVRNALDDDVDLVYGDALLIDSAGRVTRTYKAPTRISREYVLRYGTAIFSGEHAHPPRLVSPTWRARSNPSLLHGLRISGARR